MFQPAFCQLTGGKPRSALALCVCRVEIEFLACVSGLGVWLPARRGPGFLPGLAEELRFSLRALNGSARSCARRLLEEALGPWAGPVAEPQLGGERGERGNGIVRFFIFFLILTLDFESFGFFSGKKTCSESCSPQGVWGLGADVDPPP